MTIVSTLLQEPSRAAVRETGVLPVLLAFRRLRAAVRAGWEAMEEDVWGYPKLDDVLSLSWGNGRRRVRVPTNLRNTGVWKLGQWEKTVRVPHTVADRYGIPVPAMTCHEEKSVKTMFARVMGVGRAVSLRGCRRGWKHVRVSLADDAGGGVEAVPCSRMPLVGMSGSSWAHRGHNSW